MKNIDKELIEWAVNKIQTEYKDDISLLIGQVGGGKIPTDRQSMTFDFFIPSTERGNQLARTFIIEDMGYDLYPISWERLEKIVNIEEPLMIFAIAKGEVIYAKSQEDRRRFEALKAEMLSKLQDSQFQMPKCLEFLETAQEVFQTMLFEESLCKIRKAAGGVCCYLMHTIAMVNGTYLKSGYMHLTENLHMMKEYPCEFEKVFTEMLSENHVGAIKGKVYELIRMTRDFLMKRVIKDEESPSEPNFEDLAMWYQEMRYTFRRLAYFTGINDAENSYLLGCYLQIEFDAVQDDFHLKKMDLLSVFNKDDLREFAEKSEEIERYITDVIAESNVRQNKYSSLEEFIKENK